MNNSVYGETDDLHAHINFRIERQQMSNWCWAAVATSIFRYYIPHTTLVQKRLVADFLRLPICNHSPAPVCNQRSSLSNVLDWLRIFNGLEDGPSSPLAILNELENGRPLGCLLWNESYAGHYAVISSITINPASQQASLKLYDPVDASFRIVNYMDLVNGFQGSYWVKTYFTRGLS